MPANRESLLAGRNPAPLSEQEVRCATNTFLGLDGTAPVRYEADSRTRFRIVQDGDGGDDVAEILFGRICTLARALLTRIRRSACKQQPLMNYIMSPLSLARPNRDC